MNDKDLFDAIVLVYGVQCKFPICEIWRYLERVKDHINAKRIIALDIEFARVQTQMNALTQQDIIDSMR